MILSRSSPTYTDDFWPTETEIIVAIVLSYKVCSDFDITIEELIQFHEYFALLSILKYIVLNIIFILIIEFFGTPFNFVLVTTVSHYLTNFDPLSLA